MPVLGWFTQLFSGNDMKPKCEVYRDTAGQWRWRLLASNHKSISVSGEGFSSKQAAVRAAHGMIRNAGCAQVTIETD